MVNSFKQRIALMNSLCRICAQEDKNCVPVFSESGKKQEIEKKIRLCLPLVIEEVDKLPKQICLTCLHKLDASWELFQLCKDGQVLIEEKLYSLSEIKRREEIALKNPTLIDEKVRSLSEDQPITIGDSAIITLVPVVEPPPIEVPPPVTSAPVMGIMSTYQVPPAPEPVTSIAPSTVAPPDSDTNNVYSQCLIKALPPNKPVLYQPQPNNVVQPPQCSLPQAKPMVPQPKTDRSPSGPTLSPQRIKPSTSKRAMRNRNSPSVPTPKKALLLCKFCNKSFPDEIIDHHVSLHLRQSFFTCIDCNKNFRSEMAMSRHRCGTTEVVACDDMSDKPIDLDDDLICL